MLTTREMKTLPEDWEAWTWDDIEAFIKTHGFDNDEYMSLSANKDIRNQRVWHNSVHSVEAHWRPGANEGYMVFVEQVTFRASTIYGVREYRHETVLLGKFWSAHRAEWCANLLTRALYGLPHDSLLPAFRYGQTVRYLDRDWEIAEMWPGKLLLSYADDPAWQISISPEQLD